MSPFQREHFKCQNVIFEAVYVLVFRGYLGKSVVSFHSTLSNKQPTDFFAFWRDRNGHGNCKPPRKVVIETYLRHTGRHRNFADNNKNKTVMRTCCWLNLVLSRIYKLYIYIIKHMSRGFPDTVSSTEIVESSAMQKKTYQKPIHPKWVFEAWRCFDFSQVTGSLWK